jgi:DNA-binding transcriptional LysR family regulator
MIISNVDQWLGLEFRHLAALRAVAEHRSFSRAALALGYTQSAVSQQIAVLERIVGERLVDRPPGPRPVSLTPTGLLLLRHADALVARLAAARADMAAFALGETGPLRVGIYQSVGARLLPTVMRRFTAAWPRIEVLLHEANDDRQLLAQIENGELDLTFVSYPLTPGPFADRLLLRDPLVLLIAADSVLGRQGAPVTPRQVAELPLIAYSEHVSGEPYTNRLRTRGYEPRIVFRSDDHGTIHGLVAAGFGAALIPRLGVDPDRHDTVALEIGTRMAPRLIGLAWHRDRQIRPAESAFVEVAAAVAAEVEASSA